MSRLVEANEPDTINYEFYLNKAETKCIVNETYTNSEAAFAHAKGVALQTILPKIFNISRVTRFDVYGNPNGACYFYDPFLYVNYRNAYNWKKKYKEYGLDGIRSKSTTTKHK